MGKDREIGLDRVAILEGDAQEVGEQLLTMGCEDALGVELDPLGLVLGVAQTHDLTIVGVGRDLQT